MLMIPVLVRRNSVSLYPSIFHLHHINKGRSVCDPDADAVFQSCDGVLFRVHKQYLHHACGGFPPAELPTYDEVVSLTEVAKVLELLFAFVYPRRHPFLDGLDAMTLFALAEAVEKYEVFAGMGICLIRMKCVDLRYDHYLTSCPLCFVYREQVAHHPILVLNYAARHGYSKVMDEAAYLTVGLSLKTIAQSMDIDILKAWVRPTIPTHSRC